MSFTKVFTIGMAVGLANLPSSVDAKNLAVADDAENESFKMSITTPDGTVLPVSDQTKWTKEKTAKLRKEQPDRVKKENNHFIQYKLERTLDKNSRKAQQLLKYLEQQDKKNITKEKTGPVPGGTGYGVSFNGDSLNWSNNTCIYIDYIVPKTPGGDVTNWLYNTSTNRSNLGVEAYISYFGQREFNFKVFDWSYAGSGTSPWVVEIAYSDLTDYLVSEVNDDNVFRQELHVVNCTSGAGTSWNNSVWLRNYQTGTYDQVYNYNYTTTNDSDNTYENGDRVGWWGPIFETFQDHDGSNKAIGTAGSWLLQDGNWITLSDSNSHIRIDDEDLDPPIFQTLNKAWAVGSTAGEFTQSLQEANVLHWQAGSVVGSDVIATAQDTSGWMLFSDLYGQVPRAGQYVAQFDISTANLGVGEVAWAVVYDSSTNTFLETKSVNLEDFHSVNATQPFRLEFSTTDSTHVVVGLYFNSGIGTVKVDRVVVSEI